MITLTTDFGTRDPYVAEMKAVALRINSQVSFVDISHHVSPQNVLEGAFVLGSAYRYFPQDAIHVAVVDPGVGTSRRAILLTTPDGCFLAPDNGLLTYVVRNSDEYDAAIRGRGFAEAVSVPIPAGRAAYELSNQDCACFRSAIHFTAATSLHPRRRTCPWACRPGRWAPGSIP